MTDEDPFRILLIVVAVLQTVISVHYGRKARVGSTMLRRREEGIFLTSAVVLFHLAYSIAFAAYLLNPTWMAWSAVGIPSMVRWIEAVPLQLGTAFMV